MKQSTRMNSVFLKNQKCTQDLSGSRISSHHPPKWGGTGPFSTSTSCEHPQCLAHARLGLILPGHALSGKDQFPETPSGCEKSTKGAPHHSHGSHAQNARCKLRVHTFPWRQNAAIAILDSAEGPGGRDLWLNKAYLPRSASSGPRREKTGLPAKSPLRYMQLGDACCLTTECSWKPQSRSRAQTGQRLVEPGTGAQKVW